MWARRYLEVLETRLAEIAEREAESIARAAEAVGGALSGGGVLWLFGCGHGAMLAMDLFYRAGGLLLAHPIFDEGVLLTHRPVTETSERERREDWAPECFRASGARAGDAMIVFSTSGRNGAPVEMARLAREAGLRVIAVTSRAYAESVPSRHSSGKRLHDMADVVVDNRVDPGDAAVELPGMQQKVGPTSTALSSAIGQAIVVEAIAGLLAKEQQPPVYVSANLPGGSEHNEAILERYRDRIRFM